MEKLKIAITQIGTDTTSADLVRQVCEDPILLELCTPIACDRETDATAADAQVIVPTSEPVKCPADATLIIATDKTNFMPLGKEPTAEDIIRLRDILERDFDRRSPRIAIVQDSPMQNPELTSQVTNEQGINTYGPYTVEKFLSEDAACHFDCIITTDGETTCGRIITELAQGAPVRFFAGREPVVTAVYQPIRANEGEEEGLADVSALTHPFYLAIDIVRNRAFYDEVRQNPLPKLYHDKREDRRKDNAPQANDNKEDKEQES